MKSLQVCTVHKSNGLGFYQHLLNCFCPCIMVVLILYYAKYLPISIFDQLFREAYSIDFPSTFNKRCKHFSLSLWCLLTERDAFSKPPLFAATWYVYFSVQLYQTNLRSN